MFPTTGKLVFRPFKHISNQVDLVKGTELGKVSHKFDNYEILVFEEFGRDLMTAAYTDGIMDLPEPAERVQEKWFYYKRNDRPLVPPIRSSMILSFIWALSLVQHDACCHSFVPYVCHCSMRILVRDRSASIVFQKSCSSNLCEMTVFVRQDPNLDHKHLFLSRDYVIVNFLDFPRVS